MESNCLYAVNFLVIMMFVLQPFTWKPLAPFFSVVPILLFIYFFLIKRTHFLELTNVGSEHDCAENKKAYYHPAVFRGLLIDVNPICIG